LSDRSRHRDGREDRPSNTDQPGEHPGKGESRGARSIVRALYTACVLLFLVDFVYHRHVVHPIERFWGFYAVYGWLSCVTLVVLSKQMRRFLMRPESYYDGNEDR